MRRVILGVVAGAVAFVGLGVASASASPVPGQVGFIASCGKGAGFITAGHGHDYPYIQCNGGRYDGDRYYIK